MIVVSGNRPALLERCIRSVHAACAAQSIFEIQIVVVLNGPQPEVKAIQDRHPELLWISTQPVSPGVARNLALDQTQNELLFFLDDDAFLSSDYFERAALGMSSVGAWDVLGGPDRTPPNATLPQLALGLALQSPFATGPTRHRFSSLLTRPVPANEKKLILCNLWIRRTSLSELRFDPAFFRNEENVLLKQLEKKFGRIFYDPGLFVYHERKSGLRDLTRALGRSGFYRAKCILKSPRFFELEYALPALFVAYLLALPLLRALSWLWVLPLALLAVAIAFQSANACRKYGQTKLSPLVALYQLWILLCHGSGFIYSLGLGLLKARDF